MHRFYLPPEQAKGPALTLSGPEAHHAVRVLRVRRGDTVTVLDGVGLQCACEVEQTARDRVMLKVFERRQVPPLPCQVTLLQALPKGKLIESIIQKATELGVWRIVPLLTERVVAKLDLEASAHKALKWQAIAVEAIKQCGSAWLPKVDPPATPEQHLASDAQPELSLIGSLQQGARHPRQYFQEFENARHRKPSSIAVWIGPEGDFAPAELELAQSAGALPITLGPLVLRTETAALYCLSVINYEVQYPAATAAT